MLTPQHALGHPGRPAGVENVEVVSARGRHPAGGWRCGSDGFVVHRAGNQCIAGVVGNLDENVEVGQAVTYGEYVGGELGRVDQRAGAGVVEKVEQLLFDVAVVDVERRDPGAVAGHHGFEVLVAVAQIQPDVVLPGLVALQLIAFDVTTESLLSQVVGDAVDAGVQLRVAQPAVPPDQHSLFRDGRRDGAEHGGQIEGGVGHKHTVFVVRRGQYSPSGGGIESVQSHLTDTMRPHREQSPDRLPSPHRSLVGQR